MALYAVDHTFIPPFGTGGSEGFDSYAGNHGEFVAPSFIEGEWLLAVRPEHVQG